MGSGDFSEPQKVDLFPPNFTFENEDILFEDSEVMLEEMLESLKKNPFFNLGSTQATPQSQDPQVPSINVGEEISPDGEFPASFEQEKVDLFASEGSQKIWTLLKDVNMELGKDIFEQEVSPGAPDFMIGEALWAGDAGDVSEGQNDAEGEDSSAPSSSVHQTITNFITNSD
jgi:hypothetical protein